MKTLEMRDEVTNWLKDLDDGFLAAVHAMVGTYVQRRTDAVKSEVFGYDADGNPLYATEMKEVYAAELEGVKRGEYLTIEDFEKESAKW